VEKILKFIRSIILINLLVRIIVKGSFLFTKKAFDYYSLHWPVYGTISYALPNKKKIKIFSKGDDFVSTQAFWKGYDGYEGPSIRLFYQLSTLSQTIFDVGANVGYFSLVGAGANKNAKVFAFEPIPIVFERLVKNLEINKLDNAKAINAAVGESVAQLKFYVPNIIGMPLASSTKKGWYEDSTEIEVKSTSLDHFKTKEKLNRIDLIKIDCEFHETEILNGMKSILSIDKPLILMEILFPEEKGVKGHFENHNYVDIERIMKENGYYFYMVNEAGLIRMDKLEFNPEERNYLFSTKKSGNTYLPFSDIDSLFKNII